MRLDELLASACIPGSSWLPLLVDAGDGSGPAGGTFLLGRPVFPESADQRFLRRPHARSKPDLLWVVQINPNRYEGPDCGPDTPDEQADRRNELAGNLSLGQERAIDVGTRSPSSWPSCQSSTAPWLTTSR